MRKCNSVSRSLSPSLATIKAWQTCQLTHWRAAMCLSLPACMPVCLSVYIIACLPPSLFRGAWLQMRDPGWFVCRTVYKRPRCPRRAVEIGWEGLEGREQLRLSRRKHCRRLDYIRNTPNFVGPPGLWRAAASASPSTIRESAGLITPSSQRRALA